MDLPEHARKARRSSKQCKNKLPKVGELLTDLGLNTRLTPSPDMALVREFDNALKNYTDKFLEKKNLQRVELTSWSVPFNQKIFRQLATSFLQEGGRGSYFWPDEPSASNKKGYRYSKDRKKICDLVMPLVFRRNKILMNNQKNRINPTYPVTLLPRRTADAVQPQAVQQQPSSEEITDTPSLGSNNVSGSSFETPIDVDGLPEYAFDDRIDDDDFGDDDGPRNPKYLRDPGLPSPELSLPPMAPRPATVEGEVDEYSLEPHNPALREVTYTVSPEQTDVVPAQDPYDVPNTPETAAPAIDRGEKRPAETELEDPARRTKSPRLEQDNAAVTTTASGVGDDGDASSPSLVGPVAGISDEETRQTQLYDYVFNDLGRTDGLPESTSLRGSPELGEDAHRETLAQRLGPLSPPSKASTALMSEAADPEPEMEAETPQKQQERDSLEDVPLDEPPKAQAHPKEAMPQDSVPSVQQETDDHPQDKLQNTPLRSEEPARFTHVIKGKQQAKAPQAEDILRHEPTREPTFGPPLNFAFTVYQTEMRPMVWKYSERLFFKRSLRQLVDDLPMEDKDTLKGLCISLMGKRPDQYQVFLYNDVKYENVRDIYRTTIKQETQEARLDGSRLDYEIIIRPIR
ncbi:hypothetical protein ACHAPT_000227 [Fusarium lateritium]